MCLIQILETPKSISEIKNQQFPLGSQQVLCRGCSKYTS